MDKKELRKWAKEERKKLDIEALSVEFVQKLRESDEYIKKIWQEHFEMEVAHLKRASHLLKKYEKKNIESVIPNPEFPRLIKFGENKKYIREVLKTVGITSVKEKYVEVKDLPKDCRFLTHLKIVNGNIEKVPSHMVINKYIEKFGKDYRFEEKPHPVKALQDRKKDNVTVGAM